MKEVISEATKRNWEKLQNTDREKLTKRANKVWSKKKIIPKEYFTHKQNISLVIEINNRYENGGYSVEEFMYTLGILLLQQHNMVEQPNVKKVLEPYKDYTFLKELSNIQIPMDEQDILGSIYQSILSEGNKNQKGSYYTPEKVAKNMTCDLDFSNGQTLLDPCCGSGAFLLAVKASPTQLFGMDNDPIAVMIAKINLLIKYKGIDFIPQIICDDFLENSNLEKYNYIITNPPWGGKENIEIKETFSYFFTKSFYQILENGVIRFLLPESVLNVKKHSGIRKFMLENCAIESITLYDETFSGVVTKYIDIKCSKKNKNQELILYHNQEEKIIDIGSFYETENYVFNFLEKKDLEIIQKIKRKGKYSLENSIWSIGIVTGDNKNKIKNEFKPGMEPIYRGKDIEPYHIKETNDYIVYHRSELQQVGKEDIYRAKEKLVYKFISKKLAFAYDDQQRLFLNSANILIPNIPNMSIKTVMAFLNSIVFQFFYSKMFRELKVLRGNLSELPFPQLTQQENQELEQLVTEIMEGKKESEEMDLRIYKFYELSEEQIQYIRGDVCGKTPS